MCASARNPTLAYGRMTGWGQDGPLAQAAGHDINYIALAGALRNFVRPPDRPVAPLNLVGDFGGGGMLLAFGLLCAIHEAARSGRGQVVDAAMVDGTAVLTTMFHGLRAQGLWYDEPGTNWADSGAPYYEVFETADGEYVTVGALERPFYDELVERLGLDAAELPPRGDEANWPDLKERFAAVFRTRTRDEWCELLEGTDVVLRAGALLRGGALHPHNVARSTFVEHGGVVQPAPAPRFGRTPPALSFPPPLPGEHTSAVLVGLGLQRATRSIDSGQDGGAGRGPSDVAPSLVSRRRGRSRDRERDEAAVRPDGGDVDEGQLAPAPRARRRGRRPGP